MVPAVLDYFTLGEHHFLVEEFVDGNPLQRLLVQRYPLTRPDCPTRPSPSTPSGRSACCARVERAVEALHERGVVFGDLHPANILVTADGRLVLIDFEVATLAEDQPARRWRTRLSARRPTGRASTVDRYALACLPPRAVRPADHDDAAARTAAKAASWPS